MTTDTTATPSASTPFGSTPTAPDRSAVPPVGAPRQLRRRRPRWLGGVSAGLAEYTGLPTALVRLLFVVAGFMGWGLLLYPALWIVVPEA